MPKLQRSLQIGIAAGAIVLIAGALGFLVWQNFAVKSPEPSRQAVDTTEADEAPSEDVDAPQPVDADIEEAADGMIVGTLTYPSHGLPPDLEVFAENTDTGTVYSTREQIVDTRFSTGIGYRLSVPAGSYHVYGTTSWQQDQRAYYDNFIKHCNYDTTACVNPAARIVVSVNPGMETEDVTVGDWYNMCVIPGGKQPTQKFDLPTC